MKKTRRDFLKSSLACAAAAALPSCSSDKQGQIALLCRYGIRDDPYRY